MIQKLRIEEVRQPANEPTMVIYVFEFWNETQDIDGNTVTVKTGEQQTTKKEFDAAVAEITVRQALIAEAV